MSHGIWIMRIMRHGLFDKVKESPEAFSISLIHGSTNIKRRKLHIQQHNYILQANPQERVIQK